MGLLAEEWNIRIRGGPFIYFLAKGLAIIGIFLFIFKKHVTLLVDDGKAEEVQSNIRSEREEDKDH